VSNVQARLIASSLALIAGSILWLATPQEASLGPGAMIVAGVLFAVEYIRTQLPERGS
jgi:hypothetical protein